MKREVLHLITACLFGMLAADSWAWSVINSFIHYDGRSIVNWMMAGVFATLAATFFHRYLNPEKKP
jgi:hypothetical protein